MASGCKRWYFLRSYRSYDCVTHSSLQIQMLLVDTWLVVCLIPYVTFLIFLHLSNPRSSNLQLTSGLYKFDAYHVEFWNRRNDLYSLEGTIKSEYQFRIANSFYRIFLNLSVKIFE